MSLSLNVQTLVDDGTGPLRSIKPDKDGVFKGFPLTVLGVRSSNGRLYDPQSAMAAMSDMSAPFAAGIKGGGREGEWGHPVIAQAMADPDRKRAALTRMLDVDRTKVSHRIINIYTEQLASGAILVRGDLKPSGPYGELFAKEMADPSINIGQSLRAYTVPSPSDPAKLEMKAMVTFDAVATPGFNATTKRGMPVTEQFSVIDYGEVEISLDDVLLCGEVRRSISVEALNDQELLDKLGMNRVFVCNESIGFFEPKLFRIKKPGKLIDSESVFHCCFSKVLEMEEYR
jgi:hypothetical protein